MLLVRKSIGLLVPFTMVMVYLFVLNTDRNLKPLTVGLSTLENSRNGLYRVSARIVDINQGDFTISDGDTSIKIFGVLQDKKLSNLYTTDSKLYGEISLKKGNGSYVLVSLKRIEDELYVDNSSAIKDKVIYNSKGVIGVFK